MEGQRRQECQLGFWVGACGVLTRLLVLCLKWVVQHTVMHHNDTNAEGAVSPPAAPHTRMHDPSFAHSPAPPPPLPYPQDPDLYHYFYVLRDTPTEKWNRFHSLQASK